MYSIDHNCVIVSLPYCNILSAATSHVCRDSRAQGGSQALAARAMGGGRGEGAKGSWSDQASSQRGRGEELNATFPHKGPSFSLHGMRSSFDSVVVVVDAPASEAGVFM